MDEHVPRLRGRMVDRCTKREIRGKLSFVLLYPGTMHVNAATYDNNYYYGHTNN